MIHASLAERVRGFSNNRAVDNPVDQRARAGEYRGSICAPIHHPCSVTVQTVDVCELQRDKETGVDMGKQQSFHNPQHLLLQLPKYLSFITTTVESELA